MLRSRRLSMREVAADDADFVVRVRNTAEARAGFFSSVVVTADTHRHFLFHRLAHDLVFVFETRNDGFMVSYPEQRPTPISMGSLQVDVAAHTAEYGRFIVDPALHGKGYALETHYLLLSYAYDVLRLKSLWCDVLEDNKIVEIDASVGFVAQGVDLPGHTNPRGPVVHMTYDGATWPKFKAEIEARLDKHTKPSDIGRVVGGHWLGGRTVGGIKLVEEE